MSKNKEKGKIETYEDAVAAVDAAKAERSEANSALKSYQMKNKLKLNEDYSKDKKHGAEFSKLSGALKAAREKVKAADEVAKELKPAANRVTKYEYPDDVVTASDKKRYRAAARAAAKKADKPEKEAKTEKKKKKDAEPEVEEKTSKKGKEEATGKKKKKKKATSED